MQKRSIDKRALSAILESGIERLVLVIDRDAREKLIGYLELLHKWNRVYNLTAIREPHEMVVHHLLDSLAILPYVNGDRWLDVGSGAGLPGMVLAIARPDWHVTMLDSNSKKTGFLQQAAIELGLTNAEIKCTRVEDLGVEQKYDSIVSRAFAELGDFLRITRHLIATDGRWFAMKGLPERELLDIPDDCLVEEIIALDVPDLHAARSLVIARVREEEAA